MLKAAFVSTDRFTQEAFIDSDTRARPEAAPFSEELDRVFLEETLRLARHSVERGSSPVGAIMVDAHGEIIGRGSNRTGEPFDEDEQRPRNASLAHAEMDLCYQLERLKDLETLTLYTSLEPCLMCGGASALLGVGRIVWATDDTWGGSGRLIAWDEYPAMQQTEVLLHPSLIWNQKRPGCSLRRRRRPFPKKGGNSGNNVIQKRHLDFRMAEYGGLNTSVQPAH